jgi:hypothetical protein
MTLFLHRFFGALVLDAEAFEDIERDRHAAMQSVVVVMAVCAAAGVGALGLGAGLPGVLGGTILALGGWLMWAGLVVTLGTTTFPERGTHTDVPELLRVLGFAAAPGIFIAFAAMPAVAPPVLAIVVVWMLAAAITGVRHALDYQSTARALTVCVIAWLLSIAVVGAVATIFASRVS